MKVIFNIQNFKKTILFIQGFRKHYLNWNLSETNKPINIESNLSKSCNTILLDLDDNDYQKSITILSEEIYQHLSPLITSKITIVAHSYGAFYALKLAEFYPKIFSRVLLLDPTIKSPEYLDYLKLKKSNDSLELFKITHFEELPSPLILNNNIIVRIHFNISTNEDLNKINYLDQLTNKNCKSRLILHYNISHMIHYTIPAVIIDSIKEIATF